MKDLFSLEGPLLSALSRAADLVAANVLFLLCSIPIVTIGASAAALSKVTQDMAMNGEGKVARIFFAAFKENFAQATVCWLVMLAVIAGLTLDFLLIDGHYTGVMQTAMLVVWAAIWVLLICVGCYLFPLLTRYQNSLKAHFNNALLLAVGKLPRTLAMLALHGLGPVIFFVNPELFAKILIFWVAAGFSAVSYLDSLLLRPVFRELERQEETEVEV